MLCISWLIIVTAFRWWRLGESTPLSYTLFHPLRTIYLLQYFYFFPLHTLPVSLSWINPFLADTYTRTHTHRMESETSSETSSNMSSQMSSPHVRRSPLSQPWSSREMVFLSLLLEINVSVSVCLCQSVPPWICVSVNPVSLNLCLPGSTDLCLYPCVSSNLRLSDLSLPLCLCVPVCRCVCVCFSVSHALNVDGIRIQRWIICGENVVAVSS